MPIKEPLYRKLATLVESRANCELSGNTEWHGKYTDRILKLVKEYMPSGSGFDSGTRIDFDASLPDKLVFTFGYHHMDDQGSYDGWTEHKAIVTPSLGHRFYLHITGRNRNDIKDYAGEVYHHALSVEVEE